MTAARMITQRWATWLRRVSIRHALVLAATALIAIGLGGALVGAKVPAPEPPHPPLYTVTTDDDGIVWYQPFNAAKRIAAETNRPLLVYALHGEPQAFR